MRKSKFSESLIIKTLKEIEQGRGVPEVAKELCIDKSTIYYWRKKYGGMEVAHMKRLKELEEWLFRSYDATIFGQIAPL